MFSDDFLTTHCEERAERHLTEMTKMFKRAQRNYEQLGGTVEDVVTSNEQHDLEKYVLLITAGNDF